MQNSVAKKIFAVGSAIAMTAAFLAPLAVQADAAHAAGTNVSAPDGAVWMVMPDGTRRAYTSAGAFLSYGFNSWSQVVTASAADLALPTGSFIPPQDGSIMCSDRGADKGTCYEVSGGQKYGFTSAAVFTGLGFSFSNSKSGDVSWMTLGSTLINSVTPAHLPGTLVNNGGTVQLVGNNVLLGIPDLATFNSWGYSFTKVVPANSMDKALTQNGVMATRIAGQLSPTALASTGCTTNCNVQSGSASVSLSSDTPAAGTLVSTQTVNGVTPPGQTGADLAHFTFSGSGTITQVVINRIGVSADTSVNNVYLYQGNNRITDAGTLSNGKVTFSNSNGLFTISGSTEISVRVDVAGGISGQTLGAQLASFTVANGSPVATSVSGNLMTIASVSNLASVTIAPMSNNYQTPITSSGANNGCISSTGVAQTCTINAGTMNAVLWSAPVTVSQRNVLLKYIAFKQIGSISPSAIQNLHLYVDGTVVGNVASISNSGSNTNVVIFDLTGNPFTLTTGGHTLELHGDIVGGTSYNYNFTLQQAADVVLFDTNYSVNVPFTYTSGQQVFQLSPGTTVISSGSVSMQQDPTFTATQFVQNASQVTLGQWTLKSYGENVKVQQLQVNLAYAGALQATEGFNNLSLYVNGGMVGSSQNALYSPTYCGTTTSCTYTYGTTNLFTIPAGTTVTVALKGDSTFLPITGTPQTNVTGVQASLIAPNNAYQGVTSYTLSGNQNVASVSLTTTGSTANLAKNTAYSDQTIGSNTTAQKIGSYVIQSGSADGVRVTSLTVALNGSMTQPVTQSFANLYLVTPTGNTTPVNPNGTNNFAVNFTVAANQTATVDVFADVTNATGTASTTLSGSGIGATSNQSVTLAPQVGQQITVANGTLGTIALQTSSPVASFVIGGTTNQPAATFNFTSNSGGATIQELDFDITNASGTAVAVSSLSVGGVNASIVGASSTVTGLSIAVPATYSGVDVPVTASFSAVGLNGILSNQQFRINLIRVKYLSGSQTKYAPASGYAPQASSNWFDLVGSAPTVTLASSGNTLTTGNLTIGSITVSANAAGNVKVTQIPFSVASSTGVTASTVSLIDSVTGQATAVSATNIVSGAANVQLTTDNNIAAGTSKTYNIVVNVTSTGVANNYSMSVSMGGAAGFAFTDVNGNASVVGIPSAAGAAAYGGIYPNFIVNYPTNSATAHQ